MKMFSSIRTCECLCEPGRYFEAANLRLRGSGLSQEECIDGIKQSSYESEYDSGKTFLTVGEVIVFVALASSVSCEA